MNAGKAVYGILSANTGVTDIVGTRIFPEIAEQESVTPFVIYQLQSVAPEDTHDGPSKLDEVRFEFLCYADTYNGAADLATAVRGALDRVSGTYNGVNVESVQFNDVDVEIEYDPRRYSQVLKFTFRIKRDDIEIALGTPVTGAQLGDLSDVNVDGVTDNQILSYDAATDTWVAADDAGGAEQLNDLSDVNVLLPAEDEFLKYDGAEWVNDGISISQVGGLQAALDATPDALNDLTDVDAAQPTAGQLLSYGQGGWTTIDQDEVTLPIGSVTGLQAALDATPDALSDLTDVKIVGTPSEGDALVYSSGFWARGTAGASTLGDLSDVNLTTPSTGAYLQYDGADWIDSVITLPSVPSTYYHNRYATEAETLRAGATATVELYYTAQADGDGYAESAESDTASAGNVIKRKLYYSEAAQADCDTGTWVQFADIPDDTTFASAKATLLAYLKARTGGTVPISLKMTWEEVAEASLLLDVYTGAAAGYSLRQLSSTATNAVRVRRASNNDEQDIGFDGSGELDTTSLASFCSGTDGFVVTWYDQSGNANDATQGATANQPKIYDSVTGVVTENGKPAVQFDGSNDYLESANVISGTTARSILSVNNDTGGSNSSIYTATKTNTGSGTRYLFGTSNNGSNIQLVVRGGSVVGSYTGNTQHVVSHFLAASSDINTLSMFVDSSALTLTTSSEPVNTHNDNAWIGAFEGPSQYWTGTQQELIIYTSDQSTNRTNIEDNINTFYSIY